ncbi:prenylated rab acceptor PRA1 [Nadsonia fulvescens var. elongata DSM 6958]|uniref:PRA1 family protein n=1 Tax=Nadsonia fulvescens var. elongata DSM 6958 TaxID=857566 RepID=A0A1E3PDK4_9ASCO|nr:prenylated rab acceptor PRA1 [Nadsonia fulvescens var. elongata DSM 6958]
MNSFATRFASGTVSDFASKFSIDRLRNEGASLQARFANIRPPQDFFDLKRVSKPQGWGDAQSRINYNLGHFSTNYAILFALLSVYSLLTNLLLLFVIIFVAASMLFISYLGGEDLNLGFTRLTTSQLYTGLLVIAVPLGFFASPFSTVLWLIGASGVTILGHASLMEKPIESAFEETV